MMGKHATARETHDAHIDEVNRVNALKAHEGVVRRREHLRVVAAIAAPVARAYRTPIVHPYDHRAVVGHMLLAGETDDTGFSDGIC